MNATAIPPSITLKAGHVLPIWAGHPWVFAQAIQRKDKGIHPGDEVIVIDPEGKVLGRGLYSPKSAIAVRLFTSSGSHAVDAALFRQKIMRAVGRRQSAGLPNSKGDRATTGYRLIHGEGDGLPGLIVDVYGDVLIAQFGTVGLARRRDLIRDALNDVLGPSAIIDRTPPGLAKSEGFELPAKGKRALLGEIPKMLSFHERGLHYELPAEVAQKTGYYFDQRPLRDSIEALSRGSRVLDVCCYVGSIAMAAARGGAREVLAIDKSAPAIAAAKHCAKRNGLADAVRFEVGEASKAFERARADGGYDIVICDPPKMAPKRRARRNAMGGYRKLAAGACGATKLGGIVAFCSCSASISQADLQRQLALGARDAQRRALIFGRGFQGADHPVVAAFPEGLYLKVLLARIDAL